MIRILLADDHSVLRTGLRLLLNNEPDMEVVGEADQGERLLELLDHTEADLVIVDLTMPQMSGLECIKEIRSRKHAVKILVLTMHDDHYVLEAMQAGALGYVEKQALDSELFVAVRMVATGKRYLSPKNSQQLMNYLLDHEADKDPRDPFILLSVREREVLRLLVRGYSMTRIADQLCLSVKTIDTHKTRLMEKLQCTQKSELVEYALRYGLLTSQT